MMRFAFAVIVLLTLSATARAEVAECAAPTTCKTKCKAGDTGACTWLGLYYLSDDQSDDRRHAAPIGTKLLESSCTAGDHRACLGIAASLRYQFTPKPAAEARVKAIDMAACKAGHGGGCKGDAAAAAWEKQCAAGSATACLDAGTAYEPAPAHSTITIYASKPDPTKAADLTKRGLALIAASCAAGNARGCFPGDNLNVLLKVGKDAAILDKACTLGNVYGCSVSATLAGKAQLKASAAYLDKGCALGGSNLCSDLYIVHSDGRLGVKDPVGAMKYIDRACDHGMAVACLSGAKAFTRGGNGVTKNPAKAVSFYQRGCDAADAPACAGLGDAYLEGEGVTKSLDKGLAAWERGCLVMTEDDREQQNVCNDLSIMYSYGDDKTGVKKDPARAAAVRKEACARGLSSFCAK